MIRDKRQTRCAGELQYVKHLPISLSNTNSRFFELEDRISTNSDVNAFVHNRKTWNDAQQQILQAAEYQQSDYGTGTSVACF